MALQWCGQPRRRGAACLSCARHRNERQRASTLPLLALAAIRGLSAGALPSFGFRAACLTATVRLSQAGAEISYGTDKRRIRVAARFFSAFFSAAFASSLLGL